jgi:hypothetical protein
MFQKNSRRDGSLTLHISLSASYAAARGEFFASVDLDTPLSDLGGCLVPMEEKLGIVA